MHGLRVSVVELMLQDGIYYFGEHMSNKPQEVHVIPNKQFAAVIVFAFNASLVITFATVGCAIQLIFQRMTQVLTVVMVSHMFLNLRGSKPRVQDETEENDVTFGSLFEREKAYRARQSLSTWVTETIIGTLGNDLVHTSILDYY